MTHRIEQSAERGKAIIGTLMDEYKLLKSEVSGNLDSASRAISHIQMYGNILILLVGSYYIGTRTFFDKSKDAIPPSFWFLVIICATIFLYILYADIAQISFKFKVLRYRLATIEIKINKLLKTDIMSYESILSNKLFSKTTIDGKVVSPNSWIQIFSALLFVSASIIIINLSYDLFNIKSIDLFLFLCGTISYFTILLVYDNIRLNKFISVEVIINSKNENPAYKNATVAYTINYIAYMLLFYYLFASRLNSESYSFTIAYVNDFFAVISNLDRPSAFISTLVYSILCGAFLPTPSELPLGAAPNFGLPFVILACSIGKAAGAAALFFSTRFWLSRNSSIDEAISAGGSAGLIGHFNSIMPMSLAYIVCQAIPFAPMRSATIFFAATSPKTPNSVAVVVFGSAVGTVSRMLLIWWAMSFTGWIQGTELIAK